MKDLLVKLGKRVHELRVAKKWSQEEFAHVSGLHRTYIGQIERGEKNISFGNLIKVASVPGVTPSDLLSALDDGGTEPRGSKDKPDSDDERISNPARRMLEIRRLVRRLRLQRAEMDRTILALEELAVSQSGGSQPSSGRPTNRRARASKK